MKISDKKNLDFGKQSRFEPRLKNIGRYKPQSKD